MLAVLTACAIFVIVAYFLGFMQGQANGRRSMRGKYELAQMFISHAQIMEEAARMAETVGD